MVQDITGFGLRVNLIASNTYPVGITITQFADDADPLDMAAVKIADTAMGVNGDLIVWAKAVPLPAVLNVIPGSQDDANLQALADANRVGQGKVSAADILTMVVFYQDGTSTTVINGKLTDAMFGKGVSSSGRLKTRSYSMMFENKVGA